MADGMKTKITMHPGTIIPNLEAFDEKAIAAVRIVLDYYATIAATQMRSGARWTDRTSAARNGLMAKAFHKGKSSSLVLWHSVPYGIWLEVRWSGKYAIIGPTMHTIAPAIMRTIAAAIGDGSKPR